MRTIGTAMTRVLSSGDFTGDEARATTRVTIQRVVQGVYPAADSTYASIVFPASTEGARELPNLKTVQWTRSTNDMIATANITLWNTAPLPPGSLPEVGDSFDQLGYYTFNRASTAFSRTAWGHQPNVWQDMLVPDRVVRIYQGYGVDYSLPPERDPHMLLMGCFLTDDVTYGADGLITVECRDYARMLQEQIAFPPVVPLPEYPLSFVKHYRVADPPVVTTTGGPTGWIKGRYDTDSGVPYNGLNGTEQGHHGSDAFDGNPNTYWLSVGNSQPRVDYAYEFLQSKASGNTTAARIQVWGGPYVVYLSVRVRGAWQGGQVVPYNPNARPAAPNGANIPFIYSATVGKDGGLEAALGVYGIDTHGVDAVRFTFHDLYNSRLGKNPYRAGVRSFELITDTTTTTTAPTTYHTEGNFDDYTEVVKKLLAYGGFYWPQDGKIPLTGTTVQTEHFATDDPFLGKGRLWADLMMSGAPGSPPADFDSTTGQYFGELGVELFDKQPLLSGIAYVRDMLGFIFYVDEQGAAQFRLPNLFEQGSWRSDVNGLGRVRTTDYIDVRDESVILGLRAKLSSRNTRERVLVANTDGSLGALSGGRGTPSGEVNFRRVGVWTDQNFDRLSDVVVMADMITLRQLFTYRQNSLTIIADPRIQIDDQVRLTERTTGERYLHYVSAISSSWDAESGKWTYELTTSWLGISPEREWAFRTTELSEELQTYIAAVQK